MRTRRLVPLAAFLAFLTPSMASAATPAKPAKAPAPAPAPAAAAKASAASVWEPLVAPGARFVLLGAPPAASAAALSTSVTPGPRIVVESYDVRVVHGAKVARLRWVVEDNGARSPMGNSLPTQIAVTKKGAWLLTERLDDKGVAAALAHKPTFADPPRPIENDDGYVRREKTAISADAVCIGIGTPPPKPCPAGICHAEYCLAPGIGLVSMSGNYTPSAGAFVAPRPSEVFGLELRTGIPECDSFLGAWARCVQEVMAPDMRDQLNDALRQMAETYRQQAATPDGAKQAAAVCQEVAPQMNDALRGMGCHI
jgi:hypothetical protein